MANDIFVVVVLWSSATNSDNEIVSQIQKKKKQMENKTNDGNSLAIWNTKKNTNFPLRWSLRDQLVFRMWKLDFDLTLHKICDFHSDRLNPRRSVCNILYSFIYSWVLPNFFCLIFNYSLSTKATTIRLRRLPTNVSSSSISRISIRSIQLLDDPKGRRNNESSEFRDWSNDVDDIDSDESHRNPDRHQIKK